MVRTSQLAHEGSRRPSSSRQPRAGNKGERHGEQGSSQPSVSLKVIEVSSSGLSPDISAGLGTRRGAASFGIIFAQRLDSLYRAMAAGNRIQRNRPISSYTQPYECWLVLGLSAALPHPTGFRRMRFTGHFPARPAAEARAAAAMGGTRRGGVIAVTTSPSPGSDSPGRTCLPQVAHGCQLLDCRVDDSAERRLRRPGMLTGLRGRRRHVGLVPDPRLGRLLAVGGGLTHAGLLQQVGPGLLERPVQTDGDPGPERQCRSFLDGGGLGLLFRRRLPVARLARGRAVERSDCPTDKLGAMEGVKLASRAMPPSPADSTSISTRNHRHREKRRDRSNAELPSSGASPTCWNTPAVAADSTAPADCSVAPDSGWPERTPVSEPCCLVQVEGQQRCHFTSRGAGVEAEHAVGYPGEAQRGRARDIRAGDGLVQVQPPRAAQEQREPAVAGVADDQVGVAAAVESPANPETGRRPPAESSGSRRRRADQRDGVRTGVEGRDLRARPGEVAQEEPAGGLADLAYVAAFG